MRGRSIVNASYLPAGFEPATDVDLSVVGDRIYGHCPSSCAAKALHSWCSRGHSLAFLDAELWQFVEPDPTLNQSSSMLFEDSSNTSLVNADVFEGLVEWIVRNLLHLRLGAFRMWLAEAGPFIELNHAE